MDSADEAARRAVNNIFEREGLKPACKIDPYNLPSLFGLFSTARLLDYRRYHKGLEWKRNGVLVWFYKSLKKILLLNTNRLVKFLLAILWTILFLIAAFINLFYRFALKLNYVKEV